MFSAQCTCAFASSFFHYFYITHSDKYLSHSKCFRMCVYIYSNSCMNGLLTHLHLQQHASTVDSLNETFCDQTVVQIYLPFIFFFVFHFIYYMMYMNHVNLCTKLCVNTVQNRSLISNRIYIHTGPPAGPIAHMHRHVRINSWNNQLLYRSKQDNSGASRLERMKTFEYEI